VKEHWLERIKQRLLAWLFRAPSHGLRAFILSALVPGVIAAHYHEHKPPPVTMFFIGLFLFGWISLSMAEGMSLKQARFAGLLRCLGVGLVVVALGAVWLLQ
jgi:hypothetical protein